MNLNRLTRALFTCRLRSRPCRACYSSTASLQNVSKHLRDILRETAQPVAVVTTLMSPHTSAAKFHGSTVSSFTSIAMEPHPLVTFALRVPSRMATSLKAPPRPTHIVINLLCAEQASTAIRFSRPDLHPLPFSTTPFFLSKEGLPVLDGCLGALSCQVVPGSWPLHDLDSLAKNQVLEKMDAGGMSEGDVGASELFIARVIRVERPSIKEGEGDDVLRTLPLLYHRRVYTTISREEPLGHQPFNPISKD